MTAISGQGADAIRTLAKIDKLLQSGHDNGTCVLLISQEVMKFKAKTDILTMNSYQEEP
jgi:hypothetical protein